MTEHDAAAGEVWDVHQHYGTRVSDLLVDDTYPPDVRAGWVEGEYELRQQQMTSLGIHRAVLMPTNSYPARDGIADTRHANDLVDQCVRRDLHRFVRAVGVVEPQHGPASLNEIERLHELGFLGVMYHPRFQGVFADDPWILRQVALLTDLDMVALFHSVADSGLESPTLLERVLAAVPDARIVVLDAFSSHLHGVQCIELGRRWPNVWFDTALVWGMHGLRQALAELGPHRLCFGSNLYSYSPPPGAFTPARFRTECGLSRHDADAILGSNLRRLLAEAASTC